MADQTRVRRTTLVVPANRPRMIEKSATLPTDVVMLDMEDAVVYTDEAKRDARDSVRSGLRSVDFSTREVIVRINPVHSRWFEEDVLAVVEARPHAVVPAKLNSGEDVAILDAALTKAGAPPDMRIWAEAETVGAVLRCAEIVGASDRVELIRFGMGDYTVSAQGQFTDGNDHLIYPLSHVLAVARDVGIQAIGSAVVFGDLGRLDLIRKQAKFLRKLGYDGATVIHPNHLPVVNEVFTPSLEEIEWSLSQEAMMLAAAGEAAIVVDGQLVEMVNLKLARRTLAIARQLGLTPPSSGTSDGVG